MAAATGSLAQATFVTILHQSTAPVGLRHLIPQLRRIVNTELCAARGGVSAKAIAGHIQPKTRGGV